MADKTPTARLTRAGLLRVAGRETVNAGLIALGVLSAGMGLEGFLKSSNFIDGGVTDEETGKPVHFVLCGADLAELVQKAEAVRAELDGDEPDDGGVTDE